MFRVQHILFPYDFSTQCAQVVPFVRGLASRFDARITLYSVVPPAFGFAPAGIGAPGGDDATEWTRALQTRLDEALNSELAGLPVARVADSGDPALRTARFVDSHDVDLIMMPTHGLGLFRSLLVGSVTSKVLHDATCPVWTAAHADTQRVSELPKTILCAVDGGPNAQALIQWAAGFSTKVGAALKLVHVVGSITDWPALESERALQDRLRQDAQVHIESIQRAAGVEAPLRVAIGEIVPTVTEEARQEGVDLVIIGRGSVLQPFGRFRTHAFGIVQRSPCPVLSV